MASKPTRKTTPEPLSQSGECAPSVACEPDYRFVDNRAAYSQMHSIGLECHHCKVAWQGCAAECSCPECGAPKGYWPGSHDCYCDACEAERSPLSQGGRS